MATTNIAPNPSSEAVVERTDRRRKRTFMLHEPGTMKPLGKFVSNTPRSAAAKAASRGFKKILLRETGTKILREYEGGRVTLDPPKVVTRGERTVTFKTTSVVKSIGKTTWNSTTEPVDDVDVAENPSQP